MNFFDFSVNKPNGEQVDLNRYKGKLILVVNTATKCGLTPQFDGLEKLHQTYKDKGLVLLGFPCNQFMGQEPTSNDKMEEVCRINHGVTFQLFEKVKVNGSDAHPLYKHLKKEKKSGLFSSRIKWNFEKFLIGPDGKVIERFAPTTKPKEIEESILKNLPK